MKHFGKRIGALFLLLSLCLAFLPARPAYAGDSLEKAGDNISVGINGDHEVLTLTGSGGMYEYSSVARPWEEYKNSIKEVYIGPGITCVSAGAFREMPALRTIWIPDSVVSFDQNAFDVYTSLQTVRYGGLRDDYEKMLGLIPAGYTQNALSNASKEAFDQGSNTLEISLDSKDSSGMPCEKIEDYRLNLAIMYSIVYNEDPDPKNNILHKSGTETWVDFGKNGSWDMKLTFNNDFYDITYTALPKGSWGMVCDDAVWPGTCRYLYSEECGVPYFHHFRVFIPDHRADNPLKVKGRTASVKYSVLKKKNQTLALSRTIAFTKKGKGPVTYTKVSGNKKITIAKKTGKITVKKGLKKGTYKVKIKVLAAGNTEYKKAARQVTVTIKVK